MERLWTKNYPNDDEHKINSAQYVSLLDMLDNAVQNYSDLLAYINRDETLTFKQLDERSQAFAAYIQNDLKLKKGDRIALMMPNILQYPIAMFGILKAGMIAVNVNPFYTARELEYQLKDADVAAIVIAENFASTLEKVLPNFPIQHIILAKIGDQLPFFKRIATYFVLKYVKKMVPKHKLSQAVEFRKALKMGKSRQYIRPKISANDIAFLQYTGGTTGIAKGAMLSHGNLITSVSQSSWVAKRALGDFSQNRKAIVALPLYHIFALTVNCLLFVELGITSILITDPRNINHFVGELKKHPFIAITGVNTLFNSLINNSHFKKLDFSSLKLTVAGGASLQQSVAMRWQKITRCNIIVGYGMTECSPLIAATFASNHIITGCIGVPVPETDIKILDNNGQLVKPGEAGELWVKGAQVMLGYWRRPEATAEVLKAGWLATGDIVIMDENNQLHLVDRKKDMIIVSGFNVYPNEIEDVIMHNDKVLEVVAIGVPNKIAGEVIKIIVVKKDQGLTKQELKQYCRENLINYKIPKDIEFRDSLPKSNIGKVLRKVVKEEELLKQANK